MNPSRQGAGRCTGLQRATPTARIPMRPLIDVNGSFYGSDRQRRLIGQRTVYSMEHHRAQRRCEHFLGGAPMA